jgi:hypothetical protein
MHAWRSQRGCRTRRSQSIDDNRQRSRREVNCTASDRNERSLRMDFDTVLELFTFTISKPRNSFCLLGPVPKSTESASIYILFTRSNDIRIHYTIYRDSLVGWRFRYAVVNSGRRGIVARPNEYERFPFTHLLVLLVRVDGRVLFPWVHTGQRSADRGIRARQCDIANVSCAHVGLAATRFVWVRVQLCAGGSA